MGLAGLSFIAALVLNFFLFFYSYRVNKNECEYSVLEMKAIFNKLTPEQEIKKTQLDCNTKYLNRLVRRLRRGDTIAMLLGVLLLVMTSLIVFLNN
jgi:Na+/proline symporter